MLLFSLSFFSLAVISVVYIAFVSVELLKKKKMQRNLRRGAGGRNPPVPPAQVPNMVNPPVIPPPAPLPNLPLPPLRPKDPPPFHGTLEEDVVSWIARFEQISDYNLWTPEQRLRHIGMCLEGVAQKWYCSLMLRAQPPQTFAALRAELLRAFKPVNYEDHLELRLRSRVQGPSEPFTDYFYDVLYMCSRIDPLMPDRVKIQHLYRGLPPTTVRGIYRFLTPLSTTDDFFRETQVFLQGEDMATRRGSLSIPPSPSFHVKEEKEIPPPVPAPPPAQPGNSVTKEDLESLERRLERRLVDRLTQSLSDVVRRDSQRETGDAESQSSNPRYPERNKRTIDGRPICNICGKAGHIARSCRNKTPRDGESKLKPPFQPSPKTDPDAGTSGTKGKK